MCHWWKSRHQASSCSPLVALRDTSEVTNHWLRSCMLRWVMRCAHSPPTRNMRVMALVSAMVGWLQQLLHITACSLRHRWSFLSIRHMHGWHSHQCVHSWNVWMSLVQWVLACQALMTWRRIATWCRCWSDWACIASVMWRHFAKQISSHDLVHLVAIYHVWPTVRIAIHHWPPHHRRIVCAHDDSMRPSSRAMRCWQRSTTSLSGWWSISLLMGWQ